MRVYPHILFLLFFFATTTVCAQFYIVDFDGTGIDPNLSCYGSDTDGDYFGIVDDSTTGVNDYNSTPGNKFLGGEDINSINGVTCSNPVIEFLDIDISNQTNLVLCFDVAGNEGGAGWDGAENIKFQTSIDDGIFYDLLNIANDSDANNDTSISIDADYQCDNIGDATEPVTTSFQTYCVQIPKTGFLLDLTITVTSFNGNNEDFGLDNFQFFSNESSGSPNPDNGNVLGGCFECTAMPTVSSNSTTSAISFSAVANPTNGIVNTLDDAYLVSQYGDCQSFTPKYGMVNYDSSTGTGTISDLLDKIGNSVGNIPFSLHEIDFACADDAVIGEVLTGGGTIGMDLQDSAPNPTGITNGSMITFSEGTGSGGTSGANQVCFDFTNESIRSVGFWIGDVETSDVVPGFIFLYDKSGDLMQNNEIPTSTLVSDQAVQCTGSTSADDANGDGSGVGECGNDETIFVSISTAVDIGTICIQVGDFPDDITNPAASEHLSFGGMFVGGDCILCNVNCGNFPWTGN